jgi:hypothetical protein
MEIPAAASRALKLKVAMAITTRLRSWRVMVCPSRDKVELGANRVGWRRYLAIAASVPKRHHRAENPQTLRFPVISRHPPLSGTGKVVVRMTNQCNQSDSRYSRWLFANRVTFHMLFRTENPSP